jgi:hypothetical protein
MQYAMDLYQLVVITCLSDVFLWPFPQQYIISVDLSSSVLMFCFVYVVVHVVYFILSLIIIIACPAMPLSLYSCGLDVWWWYFDVLNISVIMADRSHYILKITHLLVM